MTSSIFRARAQKNIEGTEIIQGHFQNHLGKLNGLLDKKKKNNIQERKSICVDLGEFRRALWGILKNIWGYFTRGF